MKNPIKHTLIFILVFLYCSSYAQNKYDIPYGKNDDVGKSVNVNGVDLYYEVYGEGEPLLLIHGNGGSIAGSSSLIEYFKSKYKVVVADSRGHGKSGLSTDSLTYRQTAKDLEALVQHLGLDSIRIVGKSDGAIIGLLMGINNNVKINRIVAWAGNLRPDTTAVHSWAPNSVMKQRKRIKRMIDGGMKDKNLQLKYQRYGLLLFQPNITHQELEKITAPVLIVAGDRDIIKNRHSIKIFENVPKSQLCIVPGATHFAPGRQPDLFIGIVDRFISQPFSMPDSNWTKN